MKFCQPSASQSKSTQTRPFSLGSRKTCEPFDPCCFRFSRLVVENTLHQRSKSSTFVVPRNNSLLLSVLGAAARRRWCGESKPRTPGRYRANALSCADEVVLEGPERCRGPAADAG